MQTSLKIKLKPLQHMLMKKNAIIARRASQQNTNSCTFQMVLSKLNYVG